MQYTAPGSGVIIPLISKLWYPTPPGIAGFNGSTSSMTVGQLNAIPLIVPTPTSFINLTCNVGNIGAAAIVRIGIYADNGGTPVGGKLLLDAGNVNIINSGVTGNVIPINITLAPGIYWITTVLISATTKPTVYFVVPLNMYGYNYSSQNAVFTNGVLSTASTYTGVLPAIFPSISPLVLSSVVMSSFIQVA